MTLKAPSMNFEVRNLSIAFMTSSCYPSSSSCTSAIASLNYIQWMDEAEIGYNNSF